MELRTITCSAQTKTEWDSLKRQLAAALDRPVRDPDLLVFLVELGKMHRTALEAVAVEKIVEKKA